MITLPNLSAMVGEIPRKLYQQVELPTTGALMSVVMVLIGYGETVRAQDDVYGIRELREQFDFPNEHVQEPENVVYILVAADPLYSEFGEIEVIASAIYARNHPTKYTGLQIYNDDFSASMINQIINTCLNRIC